MKYFYIVFLLLLVPGLGLSGTLEINRGRNISKIEHILNKYLAKKFQYMQDFGVNDLYESISLPPLCPNFSQLQINDYTPDIIQYLYYSIFMFRGDYFGVNTYCIFRTDLQDSSSNYKIINLSNTLTYNRKTYNRKTYK